MPDHEDVRGPDRAALREEIARLQAEAERLRMGRGGADPEQVARLRAQVGQLAAQNDRLASTLRDARDQIVALKAEVDRLAQPPNTFGVYVGPAEDGTVEVVSSGRKMRVALSPSVPLEELRARPGGHAQRGVQRRGRPEVRDAPARSSSSRTSSTTTGRSWWRTPTRSASSSWPGRCGRRSCASGTP